jgi:hypothetical protein
MIIRWDGIERPVKEWNKDLTMYEAFRVSASSLLPGDRQENWQRTRCNFGWIVFLMVQKGSLRELIPFGWIIH